MVPSDSRRLLPDTTQASSMSCILNRCVDAQKLEAKNEASQAPVRTLLGLDFSASWNHRRSDYRRMLACLAMTRQFICPILMG